jgi:hypothetical protein
MLETWLSQPHALPWLAVMWMAGMLGSVGHCAGMCGPVAASFGMAQARQGGRLWPRHLGFQLGRVATYTALGAAIGWLGGLARLQTLKDMHECCRPQGQALLAAQAWPWQVWMKLGVGGLMVLMGLCLALGFRADALLELPLPGPVRRLLGRGIGWGGAPFLLGLVWGLIPCGLVYMMRLRSLDAGSWRMGAAGMACFGLGNLPLLLGLGLAGSRIGQAWRFRLLRLGGILVLAMGAAILWQALHLLRLQAAAG